MIKAICILLMISGISASAATIKTQEEYIAGVIYAEALGQSDYAKGLVATTIWMRAKGQASLFRPVCKLSRQYTRPQRNDDPEWESCMKFAKSMYKGKFKPLAYQDAQGRWIHPDHFLKHDWAHNAFLCPFWAKKQWHKKVDKLCFLMLGKYRTKENYEIAYNGQQQKRNLRAN